MKIKNKKYLITGGAGFIGSHMVDYIIEKNYYPIIIDNFSSGLKSNLKNIKKLHIINKSVQDVHLDELPRNIDGIFHLAAQASVPQSIEDFYNSSKNNMLSSLKILDWSKDLKIPVVYASSSAIYGNLPIGDDESFDYDILSPYAQDKMTLEHYAELAWGLYSIPSIGLRFFNVYGPRQDPKNPYSGVISIFLENLLSNKEVIVNGGYQTRDFIYVSDIVKVLFQSMKILEKSPICNMLNVGTGFSTTIDDLLKIISEKLNVTPNVVRKELPNGDPERSMGKYHKLNSILNLNTNDFLKLDQGIENTIKEIMREKPNEKV